MTSHQAEWERDEISIATMSGGRELSVPVLSLKGGSDGPHLAVVSLQHGNELSAFEVVRVLHNVLPSETLSGRVSVVPVANPIAFETGCRSTWVDALYGDGGNLNRVWPGSADGWLTEQLAAALWSELLQSCDLIVDLHDGISQTMKISYGYVSAAPPSAEMSELDRFRVAFGSPIMLRGPDLAGSLTTLAASEGKLSFAYEIGEFTGFEASDRQVGLKQEGSAVDSGTAVAVRGIRNLMKHSEMLEGSPELPSRQAIVSPETKVSPAHGGVLFSRVTGADIGQVLREGDVLGEVVDPYSMEVVERLVAPHAESLLIAITETAPCVRVNPGDYAYYAADWSSVAWVEN